MVDFINTEREQKSIEQNIEDVSRSDAKDGYYKYLITGESNIQDCSDNSNVEEVNIIKTEKFSLEGNCYIRRYVNHEKTYNFNCCKNLLYDTGECSLTPCPSSTDSNCDYQKNYIFNNLLRHQFWSEDGSFEFIINNRFFKNTFPDNQRDINVNSSNFIIYTYDLNLIDAKSIEDTNNMTVGFGNDFNFMNNYEYDIRLPKYYFKDNKSKKIVTAPKPVLPINLENDKKQTIIRINQEILNIFGGTEEITEDENYETFVPLVIGYDLLKNCHLIIGISDINYSNAFTENKITFKMNYQCIYKHSNNIILDERKFLKIQMRH